MKNIICLLLVLVLCMYLPCTVFAAVISPGQDGTSPTIPDDGVPDTGDNASVGTWMFVMLLALLVLIAVLVCFRKYFRQ